MTVMIGISMGIFVFLSTLGIVFYLLWFGGSFERIAQQAQGYPDYLYAPKQKVSSRKSLQDNSNLEKENLFGKDHSWEMRPLDWNMDREALFTSSHDEESDETIWFYLPYGPFENGMEMQNVLSTRCKNLHQTPYVILFHQKVVGCMIMTIEQDSKRVTIQNLWYDSSLHGSGLITRIMEAWLNIIMENGYRRIVWTCDAENVRGRKVAHGLGFTLEGILRQVSIVKQCNVDMAVFSIIDKEWPLIQHHLQDKVQVLDRKKQAMKEKEKQN